MTRHFVANWIQSWLDWSWRPQFDAIQWWV